MADRNFTIQLRETRVTTEHKTIAAATPEEAWEKADEQHGMRYESGEGDTIRVEVVGVEEAE